MRNLARFAVAPRGDDFVLQLEDEFGERAEFVTTAEQLDALIEAADVLLDEDDTAFEVDDEPDEAARPSR